MPIVADIHHQYRMALAALEAGVHCLRLNPGNIRKPEHIKAVAAEARTAACRSASASTAARSTRELYEKHGGRVTPEAMVESAQRELAYFDEVGFDDVKISVKASNVPLMIEAYRQLSEATDHPLHLGVTEAGPPPGRPGQGHRRHRHAAGRGHRRHDPLLAHRRPGRGGPGRPPAARGAGPARAQEPRPHRLPVVRPGRDRRDRGGQRGPGRRSASREIPLQVAVMGCVVNGPGEARDADLGIAAGRKRGHLFVKGKVVAVVPEDEMVDALVEWAEFIAEDGVEAALARADAERGRRRPRRTAPRCSTSRATTPTTPKPTSS